MDMKRGKNNIMNQTKGFFNEYSFLSNFYECTVEYNGLFYKSSEAAYQAQKCPFIANKFTNISASESKKLGKHVQIRYDWEDVKLSIMKEIVTNKFKQNPDLLEKLISTGNAELSEENYWGDKFWGTVDGVGENHLGKILMEIREELKK